MENILTEEVLQEMYFGKRPGLLKIEDYFDKIKRQYGGQNVFSYAIVREINKDPILRKIAAEIEDTFGFKEVGLAISAQKYFNARTSCFVADEDGIYDSNDQHVSYKKFTHSVTVTNSGFYINKKRVPINLVIVLNMGCLFGNNVSTGELMATLLHEIGHNFANVVMGNVIDDRAHEKFADQFVAMYGYGKEFNSIFGRVMVDKSEFDEKYKDTPFINVLVGLNQIRKGMRFSYDDEHPVTRNRMQGIISQMEADLKETPNLTPGMKKDLQAQIDICKKIMSDTFEAKDTDSTGTRMVKYFFGTFEPNVQQERIGEENATRHTSPTHLNNKISKMYHRKGWFK